MALLHDLHSRGWTVARFASLARQAELVVIADVLKEYCQGRRGFGDLLSGVTKLFVITPLLPRGWDSTL